MELKDRFKDIMLVDEDGRIEYFSIDNLDFFDLKPEELIGKKVFQLYGNLDEKNSTLMRAAGTGECSLHCVQELETKGGKRVRQISDTFCIKNGGELKGAIEFAYYNEKDDVVEQRNRRIRTDGINTCCSCTLEDMIGRTEGMMQIKRKAVKIFDLDSPVLITGETGTGKQLLARVIHDCSKRKDFPFIYVNCSALPEQLLEGILFGISKGSFTDAEEKEGLFQVAGKGSIFLDEINSMPLSTQAKLLRALEEKRVRPVGGEEVPVHARVIAACNVNIEGLLQGDQLRKDLYFRLSVIHFELPPLRERREDIPLLTEYYIQHFNQVFSTRIKGVDKKTAEIFAGHPWRGNIRELKNILEGSFHIVSGDQIKYGDICGRFEEKVESQWCTKDFLRRELDLRTYLNLFESEQLRRLIKDKNGDTDAVGKELGLSRRQVLYKMDKYGITIQG